MENSKQANFKRLAEARTNKIINTLVLLGNLANRSHYEYTAEQVESIFDAIQSELDTQKRKFLDKPSRRKFRL